MFVFSNTILRQKVATIAATSTAAAATAVCCHGVSSSSTQVSSRQLLHAASFANRTTNVQRAAVPVRSLSSSITTSSTTSPTTKSGDHQSLIINAVGTDRLGIVHDMTKKVIAVGGNVGASQAAKLGNYFSLLMLVDVPTKKITTLTQQLQTMHDLSATVHHINDTKSSAASASSSSSTIGYSGTLTLEGADNPGIVHNVTKILSNNGLNIDRMETTDEIAPNGGSVLFRMNGIAHAYEPLSSGFDAEKIRNELNQLGDDLNCDIDLIDADDGGDGN